MGRKWLSPSGWRVAFTSAARKFHVALIAAAGTTTALAADGHLDKGEVIAVVIVFLGALGVYGQKNTPPA